MNNCAYCMENELLDAFGIKICELSQSKVYLFKEQSHKGRVIVAHKKHVSEIVDLNEKERAEFIEDIAKVSNAIHKAFEPNKINYGAYGDTGCHLHFHLVPPHSSSPVLNFFYHAKVHRYRLRNITHYLEH